MALQFLYILILSLMTVILHGLYSLRVLFYLKKHAPKAQSPQHFIHWDYIVILVEAVILLLVLHVTEAAL